MTQIAVMYMKNKKFYIEAAVITILAFVWTGISYTGSRLIAGSWYHYDITIDFIDSLFPVVPWTVVIYFGCYIFWIINYFICAIGDPLDRDRFFCADALAKLIGFVIFVVFPTTNIRPEITDGGFFGSVMNLLYGIDSADNLFPSFHCLASWFCFIGVRKRKDIHIGYKLFSLIAAFAVFVSTLTTKQHVIVDVFGGVILAELAYFVAGHSKVRNIYARFFSFVLRLLRLEKDTK